MSDTIKKGLAGAIGHASASANDDAAQVATPTITAVINATGAEAENILIFEAQTACTVKLGSIIAGQAISAGANNPDLGLSKGDTAAGALTVVGTPLDGTSQAYAARTKVSIPLVAAATSLAKGEGLYLTVATNGTPADVDPFTVLVEYELAN